jgi:site-specific recombinase XerD
MEQACTSGKKLSPHTWNNKVAHMRALYNFALKTELITSRENPFNDVSIKQTEKRKKTPSKSQMTRMYLTMQQFEIQEKKARKQKSPCALYPV